MAEERIDSFIDKEKIKSEADFFLDNLEAILTQFRKINAIKLKLDGDKSFKDVADSVARLKKEEDELLKIQGQIESTYKKRIALESEQAKILAEEKELMRQRNAELKNQVREQNAAEGSLEKLRATLIRLNKEYDNLSKTERESGKGTNLKTQIQQIDAELKKLEGDTGRFQRNVGNYANAFGNAFDVLKQELNQVRQDLASGNLGGQAIADLQKREELLLQVTGNLSKEFTTMKQQSRAYQEATTQLGLALGENNQLFQEFKGQVGEGVDALNDIRDSIKLAASDTNQLDKLISATSGIVGGFSVAQGAAALLGDENEDLEKTFVKLQAAMTILNGLQAVQNELKNKDAILRKAYLFLTTAEYRNQILSIGVQKVSILQTNLQGAAESKNIVIRYAAIAAQKALNLVMSLTPTGALVAGLGLILVALSSFKADTDDAKESLARFNREMEEQNKLNEGFIDAIGTAGRKRIAQLEAEGATQTKIRAATREAMAEQLQQAKAVEDAQRGKADVAYQILSDVANKRRDIDEEEIESAKKVVDEFEKTQKKRMGIEDELYITKQNQIRDINKEIKDQDDKRLEEEKKASEKRKKQQEEETKKRREREKRDAKAGFDIIKSNLEEEANLYKSISDNDEVKMSQRIAALGRFYQLQQQAVIAQRDFDLKNTDLTENERELIKVQAAQRLLQLESEVQKQITAIKKEELKKQEEAEVEAEAKRVERIGKSLESRTNRNQNLLNQELRKAANAYLQGVITYEEYEKQKADITEKYTRKNIEAQIKAAEELLKSDAITAEQRTQYEAQISELKAQLSQLDVDNTKKANDDKTESDKKRVEKLIELLDNVKAVSDAITGAIESVVTAGIERQKNALQEQMDGIDKRKAAEIDSINAQALTAEQKAARITIAEKKAASEKEAIERKQKELDRKKAQTERVFQVFSVIGNTAMAITKALAQGNPAQAVVAGIIGAAQLAQILATPIPKYKHGREDGPATLAIVGDGGKREVVSIPGVGDFLTPDTDTLTYLPAHAKVYPDVEKYREAAFNASFKSPDMPSLVDHQRYMDDRLVKEMRATRDAIKSLPINHFHLDEEGYRKAIQNGEHFTEYINEMVRG